MSGLTTVGSEALVRYVVTTQSTGK
jgi:hypothetical protein